MLHAGSRSFRSCQAANYVRTELAIRIAHRLRDLQALPYVVVTQEGIARVYEVCAVTSYHCTSDYSYLSKLYWSAFEECVTFYHPGEHS